MENQTNLPRYKHGTYRKREFDLPDWIYQLDTDNYKVFYAPPHIVDLKMKAVDNYLLMSLGQSFASIAINSDKMQPVEFDPGYPISYHKDAEFSCKGTCLKGLIGFVFSDYYLESILEGNGKIKRLKYDIIKPPSYDKHLQQLFHLTYTAFWNHIDSTLIYIEHLLSTIIVRYSAINGVVAYRGKPSMASAQQLKRAEEYMRISLNEKLQLSQIASVAGMSPFHFSRCFKKYFSLPPHQYLQKLRLEKAKSYLKNTNYSLDVIAEKVGFTSQSHFGAFFLKQTNLSPGTFRKIFH